MRTINQINGRLANNQTIQFYNQLGQDYENRVNRWQLRYFNYKSGTGDEICRLTPSGNWIYGQAMTEFNRIAGHKDNNYRYDRNNRREVFDINGYEFRANLSQDINGVFLQIQTDFKPICNYENSFRVTYKVRSNKTFQDLDIQAYIEKYILPEYLYPKGTFRNIQICFNYTKKEALKWYRKAGQIIKDDTFVDVERAISKRISKKLNILIQDNFSDRYLFNLLRLNDRHKTKVKLFREPNMFEISEMYASEYDTDDNIEDFINDHFSSEYPKNAIFA